MSMSGNEDDVRAWDVCLFEGVWWRADGGVSSSHRHPTGQFQPYHVNTI